MDDNLCPSCGHEPDRFLQAAFDPAGEAEESVVWVCGTPKEDGSGAICACNNDIHGAE